MRITVPQLFDGRRLGSPFCVFFFFEGGGGLVVLVLMDVFSLFFFFFKCGFSGVWS